jgi:DNA repair protein RecN (Recombination protein N)
VLTHLQLRDFVIVEHADLEFGAGLAALTGETGAGKSVVVDALSMLAGGRAGETFVRQGAERAEATAVFTDLPAHALQWLAQQSIEHDGEVLVRRVIGLDGRSRAYINAQLVPLQSLRDFAEALVEIHGQQEFQHLVKREAQREMLDRHAGAEPLVAELAGIYGRYRDCRRQLEALEAAMADRDARLELLRYQLGELSAEVTSVAEIDELLLERKRIAGRGRLADAARSALELAYEADEGSAQDLLARAQAALRAPAEADPCLAAAAELLATAAMHVQEAADGLRRFLDVLDVDPARQEEIERRSAALEGLARKHRVTVQELPERQRRVEEDLQSLDRAQESTARLQAQSVALREEYRVAAGRLSDSRRQAAADLGKRITALMQTLGMGGGRFAVSVTAGDGEPTAHGLDTIEFLVAANPGHPPKSLAKVASGGELSRISLAVQVAAAAQTTAHCMVFDEVDAGIGGAIAEIVGRQLRELGQRGQVLCVTHLAQVASQANHQFRVTKRSDGKTTRTTIERLGDEERVEEIARMLGGVDVTSQARAHAREMLQLAAGAAAGTAAGAAAGTAPGKAATSVARPASRAGSGTSPAAPSAPKTRRSRAGR